MVSWFGYSDLAGALPGIVVHVAITTEAGNPGFSGLGVDSSPAIGPVFCLTLGDCVTNLAKPIDPAAGSIHALRDQGATPGSNPVAHFF